MLALGASTIGASIIALTVGYHEMGWFLLGSAIGSLKLQVGRSIF